MAQHYRIPISASQPMRGAFRDPNQLASMPHSSRLSLPHLHRPHLNPPKPPSLTTAPTPHPRNASRCNAHPTDPWVPPHEPHPHYPHAHHHIPPTLLPLDRRAVPPDPAVLALSQPAGAAVSYAVREVALHVVLPLVALWAVQRWLVGLEERARDAVTEGGDGPTAAATTGRPLTTPFLREVLDALPGVASAPSRVVLVLLTTTHVARSVANIAQGLGERLMLAANGGTASYETLVTAQGHIGRLLADLKLALCVLDSWLMVVYQVLLVVFGCWVLLSWKDVALNRYLQRRQASAQGKQEFARIVLPLNTVVTWSSLLASGLLIAALLGVDMRPLLVVTGGGSLLAGLATQHLLANAVSGVQMYLDRPFQVGDTISLVSGVTSYRGEVVEISALRTLLAQEDGSTVAIPNRALAEMIITNKSRNSKRAKRPPWVQSRVPLSLQLRLLLRQPEYGSVGSKLADLREAICGSGAVETEGVVAPVVEVAGYSDRGVEVIARCRLQNPSKMTAAVASGDLAPQAPERFPQLAAATRAIGGSTDGNGWEGSHHESGRGVVAGTGPDVTTVAWDGDGGHRSGHGVGGWPRGGVACRDDGIRALRQQLLLSLGPWLQANNATLSVE